MPDYYVTASWIEEGAGVCLRAGAADSWARALDLACAAARRHEERPELSIQIDYRCQPIWRLDDEGEHRLADLAPHRNPLRAAA